MELTIDQRAELQDLVKSTNVPATVATRARIVLWRAEGRLKRQVALELYFEDGDVPADLVHPLVTPIEIRIPA